MSGVVYYNVLVEIQLESTQKNVWETKNWAGNNSGNKCPWYYISKLMLMMKCLEKYQDQKLISFPVMNSIKVLFKEIFCEIECL